MAVPPQIASFIESFYAISDAADHDAWVGCFTPTAKLDMGGATASGADEIRALRLAGWGATANRKHKDVDVYVNDAQPDVALVTGTIDLDRKADGVQIRGAQWTGRMRFKDGRLDDYKVWVVSCTRARRG